MQPTNLVDHVQIVGDVENVCEAAFERVGGRDEVAEVDRSEDVVEIRPEGPSVVQAGRLHVDETVNLVRMRPHPVIHRTTSSSRRGSAPADSVREFEIAVASYYRRHRVGMYDPAW